MAPPVRPKLEKRAAARLAFVEVKGPYDSIPWQPTIERLYAWAKLNRVMPGFHPMGIYLDSPTRTPPADRRTQVAITFKGRGRADGGVRTRSLRAMTVASVSHKGPSAAFPATYERLHAWIQEHSLKAAGPPIEVYSKRPVTKHGVTTIFAKILVPVRPARAKARPRGGRARATRD